MIDLRDAIKEYVFDPENAEKNFELALAYERYKQSASAIAFFLRASERTDDDNLAYECLLKIAIHFDQQGRRNDTVEVMIKHAINLLPNRPEAYFYLIQFYRYYKKYSDGYTYANFAIQLADFSLPLLRSDVKYPGLYALLFEKAVCAWCTGKSKECREILTHIKDYHRFDLNDYYYDQLQNCLISWMNDVGLVLYDKNKHDSLRFKFEDSEKIERNYSEAFQDMFVLSATNGKKNGTYLEIGAADPTYGSNTYLLETEYGWKGIGIEYSEKLVNRHKKSRTNVVECIDALEADYSFILRFTDSFVIDYLQLDCEPAKTTYDIMMKIPFDEFKFRVITYEHDHFIDLEQIYRKKSREFLQSKGYELVVSDVAPDGKRSFEDWWIHPGLVDRAIIDQLKDVSEKPKHPEEYFYTSKNLV